MKTFIIAIFLIKGCGDQQTVSHPATNNHENQAKPNTDQQPFPIKYKNTSTSKVAITQPTTHPEENLCQQPADLQKCNAPPCEKTICAPDGSNCDHFHCLVNEHDYGLGHRNWFRECYVRKYLKTKETHEKCDKLINNTTKTILNISWGTNLYNCVQPTEQQLKDFYLRHHAYKTITVRYPGLNEVNDKGNINIVLTYLYDVTQQSNELLQVKKNFLNYTHNLKTYYQPKIDTCSTN